MATFSRGIGTPGRLFDGDFVMFFLSFYVEMTMNQSDTISDA